MEINESTLNIFRLSRCLGLAPIYIRRTKKGGVVEIKRSKLLSIYSFLLGLSTAFILYEIIMDFNIKYKIILPTSTTIIKMITALDLVMAVTTSMSAIGCGLCSVKAAQELNARLTKIDFTLHLFSNLQYVCKIYIKMVAIIYLLTVAIFSFKISSSTQLNPKNIIERLIIRYFLAYGHYLVRIGFQVSFANTTFRISRRFRKLNQILEYNFITDKNIFGVKKLQNNYKKKNSVSTLTALGSIYRLKKKSFPEESCRADLMQSLACCHQSLCSCVQIVSDNYGIAVLCVLISCLLHLLRSAYFQTLAVLNPNDIRILWDQVWWIILNLLKLLIYVEPCNMAKVESKKTMEILSAIKRTTNEPRLGEEIQKFWHQLLPIDVQFTAFGVCCINREILKSFSSIIATYLIILVQLKDFHAH